MKTVAVIRADLEVSPIGTSSRLADELGGVPVLTRTLRRASAASRLDHIVVVCPSSQYDQVCRLADVRKVTVSKFDGPEYLTRQTVLTARKWALESWRGGVGNTCFFDEHIHPPLCLALARQQQAEVVLGIAAEGPLIDPQLIDRMVDHYESQSAIDDLRMVFAQAPPGLVPTLLHPTLLEDVVKMNFSPGWLNSYRPDQPRRDLITKPTCFRPPLIVQYATGRLTSDTRRGFEILARIADNTEENISSEEICKKLMHIRNNEPEALPREIQIELTTDDQHARTILRPRGEIVGRRSPMTIDLFRKIVEEFSQYDDSLVVLGGFGEPFLHPQFIEFLKLCREVGLYGLAVRTNGIALTEEIIRELVDLEVDIVQVLMDATTAEKYMRLHGCDQWDTVRRNIESLNQIRQSMKKVIPITTATIVKAKETFDDMDEFFDRWLRYSGWAVIEGYSHHAGMLPDRCVMSMASPHREPCRQLRNRCTVLSDGRVVGCDQDFQGRYVIGDLGKRSLSEIWHGGPMQTLRDAQKVGNYAVHPMCEKCDEWHRP